MGAKTKIEWTRGDDGAMGATWNPVRGCTRVSEGCRFCYAERVAARFSGHDQPYEGFAIATPDGSRWTGKISLIEEHLRDPLRWTKPKRVFVNSMSDLFHEKLSDDDIDRVFGVMAAAPIHTFQILTKRPGRMLAWAGRNNVQAYIEGARRSAVGSFVSLFGESNVWNRWPIPNVWLGVSAEDQRTADERIPLLLATPAAVRFVSYEPALGPVDFGHYVAQSSEFAAAVDRAADDLMCTTAEAEAAKRNYARLSWIICGGESGPGARPCRIEWIRSVVDQCRGARVPVFVKQLGANVEWGRVGPCGFPRGVRYEPHGGGGATGYDRIYLKDAKGGDPREWPKDLRIRQFPKTDAARVGANGKGTHKR